MKKVFVTGVDNNDNFILEKIRKSLKLDAKTEIVCVNSLEDIPIEDRINLNSEISSIHEVNKLLAPPPIPDITFIDPSKEKRKGYERPYKYHK